MSLKRAAVLPRQEGLLLSAVLCALLLPTSDSFSAFRLPSCHPSLILPQSWVSRQSVSTNTLVMKGSAQPARKGFGFQAQAPKPKSKQSKKKKAEAAPKPSVQQPKVTYKSASLLDDVKIASNNLFMVCAHIQNQDLYSARWADNVCTSSAASGGLVASRDVEEGEILSLYPIHALGVHLGLSGNNRLREHLVYDADRDAEHFTSQNSKLRHFEGRYNVQLLDPDNFFHRTMGELHQGLFVDINPSRPHVEGWMAHLCETATDHEKTATPNAVLVPLRGAEPFAALVALTRLSEGEQLLRTNEPAMVEGAASRTLQRYSAEIGELSSYVRQAYPSSDAEADGNSKSKSGPQGAEAAAPAQREAAGGPFYQIDRSYPGLQVLHEGPDVLAIPNFLTDEECDRIIAKAEPHLIPCVTKEEASGAVRLDPQRTSTNANVPQAEVPSVVGRLQALTGCDAAQLETMQVLRYTRGQRFAPHTDGFDGPASACGFADSGRLVTAFCYLNDVAAGGETRFPQLGLGIRPRKGTAVLHFPATTTLEEDRRTEHEGAVAADDKWVIATWVWRDPRSDPRYDEAALPRLSDDVI